ncbi:MAG TPA: hypothetical protein VGH43_03340 [Jatrophihabitans sp.]
MADTGRSTALWMLIGFVTTYAVTRAITVHIRARKLRNDEPSGKAVKDIYIGGVHIHHQVWGILALIATGLLEFRFHPGSPWGDVLGALFGAAAALALDEFALWLHLDDVYWTKEGRKSIDAVMVALVISFALLADSSPFGVETKREGTTGLASVFGVMAINMVFTVMCLLKGKLATGIISLPVPLIAVIGALRLAKPTSFWARRFYKAGKMTHAHKRFGPRQQRRHERLRRLVGGR